MTTPVSFRPPITDDAAWQFIRARIDRQRQVRQRRTLVFEVAIDDRGAITNVTYQPPKERITLTTAESPAHNCEQQT